MADVKIKKDWYMINDVDRAAFAVHGCVQKCIACPAGSLVLWDSRTIHAGREAEKGRGGDHFRMIGYVCYTPRKLATPAILKRKRAIFEKNGTSNHWPHRQTAFAKTPQTYGQPLPPIKPFVRTKPLSRLGRRLAGFD